MHQYCVDWKPDSLTWSIDGNDMRTLERKNTWNATSGRFDYPQTPSRIMLSLWPAGLSGNAKGTVEWAGGEIDWNSPYMQNGYYYARFSEVSVQCYDPPSGVQKSGDKSYKYTDARGTNDTVAITNKQVILGSLMGTGENPGEAPKSGSPKPTQSVAQVPGGNPGAGVQAQETTVGAGSGSSGATNTAANAPGQTEASSGGSEGFNQGGSNTGSSTGAGASIEPRLNRVCGSAIAIVIAVLGLCAL
jgi:beta-glucanase (GH16 family)